MTDDRDLANRWEQTLGTAAGGDGWGKLDPGRTYKPADKAGGTRSGLGTLSGAATLGGTLSGGPTLGDGGTAPAAGPAGAGFDLVAEIGKGGMGVVYRARQRSLRRDIAVKFVRDDVDAAGARGAFVSEALVNGVLDHPNIVPVHELGEDGAGRAYLAMKLVGGTAWSDLLHPRSDEHRRLAAGCDLDRHLAILGSVANAVAYAHSKAIVHRDLKPENVMVGAFGEVLVMDWGIAVDIGDQPADEPRTRHRSTITAPSGTPSYLPPELAEGRGRDIGPWTDTYLLGAILHEVLTGHPPHRGATLLAVLMAAARSAPPTFAASVPAGLAAICTRALARDPADRYRSVADLQEALRLYGVHRASEKTAAAAHGALTRAASVEARQERYGAYAEAVAGFRQALALWDGNADARRGEHAARLAYARDARETGDLGLAAVQLAALDDQGADAAAERTALIAAQSAAAARERGARRNRVLLAGSALVIVAGSLGATLWVNAERSRTAEQRDRAVANERLAQEQQAEALRQRDAAEQARAGEAEQRKAAVQGAATIRRQFAGQAVREAAVHQDDSGAALLWYAEALARCQPGSTDEELHRRRLGLRFGQMPAVERVLAGADGGEDAPPTQLAVPELVDLRWLADGRLLGIGRATDIESVFMQMPIVTIRDRVLLIDPATGLVAAAGPSVLGELGIDFVAADGSHAILTRRINDETTLRVRCALGSGVLAEVPQADLAAGFAPGAKPTADGAWLVSSDGTGLRRTDLRTGRDAGTLLPGVAIEGFEPAPDGARVVAISGGGRRAHLVDIAAGREVRAIAIGGSEGGAIGIGIDPARPGAARVALAALNSLTVVEDADWSSQRQFPPRERMSFSGRPRWLKDGTLGLFEDLDPALAQCVQRFRIGGKLDHLYTTWDSRQWAEDSWIPGAQLRMLPRHPAIPNALGDDGQPGRLVMSPDRTRAVAWSTQGLPLLLKASDGFRPVRSIDTRSTLPGTTPGALSTTPDGRWLHIVTADQVLRCAADGSGLERIPHVEAPATHAWRALPGGDLLLGIGEPVVVVEWRTKRVQRFALDRERTGYDDLRCSGATVSADGRWLAVATNHGQSLQFLSDEEVDQLPKPRLLVIDLADGKTVSNQEAAGLATLWAQDHLRFSADGARVLHLDRIDEGGTVAAYPRVGGPAQPAVSPEDRAVFALDDAAARLRREAASGLPDDDHRWGVTAEGKVRWLGLAAAEMLQVHEFPGGKPLARPIPCAGTISTLSPDGLLVASADGGQLVLRDADSLTPLATLLPPQTGMVRDVRFLAGGLLAVAGDEATVLLRMPRWEGDAASARLLAACLTGRQLSEVGEVRDLQPEELRRTMATWRPAAR